MRLIATQTKQKPCYDPNDTHNDMSVLRDKKLSKNSLARQDLKPEQLLLGVTDTTNVESGSDKENGKVDSNLTPSSSAETDQARKERLRKAQLKKLEYEAKRKLSTDNISIMPEPEESGTPEPETKKHKMEISFICEDDDEFWKNMSQMQTPNGKRKRLGKDKQSPNNARKK